MVIKNLRLVNFRNFESFEIDFGAAQTLILGHNGSGKSSILEAVYFLSSGQSLKAEADAEMIRLGSSFAKVQAVLAEDKEEIVLDLTLTLSEGRVSKTGKVNDVKKSWHEFLGRLKVVEFGPEDINLVTGSPDGRRRYLNGVLNQVSPAYRQAYLSYEKVRRQRNSLLDQIHQGRAAKKELGIWNEQMLFFGQEVQRHRREYLDFLSNVLTQTGFNYFPSQISKERLEEFVDREIGAGTSLIGPHRDDFRFAIRDSRFAEKDLAAFGSRGQQRMAVFELKLGELEYFRKVVKAEPLLLLDDIFSELDGGHREEVWGKLAVGSSQVIITATEAESIPEKHLKGVETVRL